MPLGVVAAPLVEEIAVRLFLMSTIAWVVFRLTKRAWLAFAIALLLSSLVFALLHLGSAEAGRPDAGELLSRRPSDEVHAGGVTTRMGVLAVGPSVRDPLPRRRQCRASRVSGRCFLFGSRFLIHTRTARKRKRLNHK
jgi:Type II CAAX prenyl endopeptidase Rce1-like